MKVTVAMEPTVVRAALEAKGVLALAAPIPERVLKSLAELAARAAAAAVEADVAAAAAAVVAAAATKLSLPASAVVVVVAAVDKAERVARAQRAVQAVVAAVHSSCSRKVVFWLKTTSCSEPKVDPAVQVAPVQRERLDRIRPIVNWERMTEAMVALLAAVVMVVPAVQALVVVAVRAAA